MTTRVKNITTTLPISIINEMDAVAKSLNMAKNEVIIASFKSWNRARKQGDLKKAYAALANDPEWLALGELGIGDYGNNLKKWEK